MTTRNRVYRVGGMAIVLVALALVSPATRAQDLDADQMPDSYELFFRLDPTNAADAALNYDTDNLVNSDEADAWSDPWVDDTDRDGLPDGADDASPVSRLYIAWGDPNYCDATSYEYVAPIWFVSAEQADGEWLTNPCWHVSSAATQDTGGLLIRVDRNYLSNNLVMDLSFYDAPDASLYVHLVNTGDGMVVTNLFNNLMQGTDQQVLNRYILPFASYPEAAGIWFQRGTGDVKVFTTLLYVDDDGDGLDQAAEAQYGCSDYDTDSDDDGLTDYAEVMAHGTDPANPDSDGDGMNDGWEVTYGLNPLLNDASADPDNDGLTNLQEYQLGTNPIVADTDGDGMPDGWEVYYGLNPLVNDANLDPDNDGLTNLQEYQNGTNPIVADSDADGMPDGWEVANGLNPLVNDANLDPDGDGLTNLQEYQLGRDPHASGAVPDTTNATGLKVFTYLE